MGKAAEIMQIPNKNSKIVPPLATLLIVFLNSDSTFTYTIVVFFTGGGVGSDLF